MKKLMDLEDMRTVRWGDMPYADVFEAMAARQAVHYKDCRVDCRLAIMCGEKLRLVPQDWSLTNRPAYGMPKLIRYPALLGMDYLELDLVASHPRQILKYAIERRIDHATLLAAFGPRQAVVDFRASTAQLTGLPVSDIKLATNMLCYGNSLRDWMNEHGVDKLPDTLSTLKAEVAAVRDHYWLNCSDDVRAACLKHQHPHLAALSVMCQVGERQDLDRCVEELPKTSMFWGT